MSPAFVVRAGFSIAPDQAPQPLKLDIEVPLPDGDFLEVTASLGVAAMQEPKAAEAGQRLLVAADEALYEAKHAGRNCVKVVPELVV